MFNRKNAGRFALGVALVVVSWGVLTWLFSPPQLPIQKPGVVERLLRMAPDTKEETRRYLYVDGNDRRLEVVFTDGCVGLREKDENGVITTLAERRKDGGTLLYAVDDKLQVKRIVLLDKRGNLVSLDTVLGPEAYKREWFWPDGKTRRAILEVSKGREKFTVFDEKGAKRFEDLEVATDEQSDPETPQYYGGRKVTVETYTVYNGAATPKYAQTAGVSSTTYGYPGSTPPEVVIESVEEYEPGSTTVARRITPNASVEIDSTYKHLTKVETFSNGEVRYIRYLDDKNRIVRMVEKTPEGDVTTDVSDLSTAGVEVIDPAMLKVPHTPADVKLAEAMVAGNTEMHLQRLLVP